MKDLSQTNQENQPFRIRPFCYEIYAGLRKATHQCPLYAEHWKVRFEDWASSSPPSIATIKKSGENDGDDDDGE